MSCVISRSDLHSRSSKPVAFLLLSILLLPLLLSCRSGETASLEPQYVIPLPRNTGPLAFDDQYTYAVEDVAELDSSALLYKRHTDSQWTTRPLFKGDDAALNATYPLRVLHITAGAERAVMITRFALKGLKREGEARFLMLADPAAGLTRILSDSAHLATARCSLFGKSADAQSRTSAPGSDSAEGECVLPTPRVSTSHAAWVKKSGATRDAWEIELLPLAGKQKPEAIKIAAVVGRVELLALDARTLAYSLESKDRYEVLFYDITSRQSRSALLFEKTALVARTLQINASALLLTQPRYLAYALLDNTTRSTTIFLRDQEQGSERVLAQSKPGIPCVLATPGSAAFLYSCDESSGSWTLYDPVRTLERRLQGPPSSSALAGQSLFALTNAERSTLTLFASPGR